MNKFPIAILALTLSVPAFAAEGFASLEEQMTGKEFTAAGLQKLSPAELDALNEWIRAHSVATLDAPKAGAYSAAPGGEIDERGFEVRDMKMERKPIQSRIKGNFTGWDGKTVFVFAVLDLAK